MNITLNHTIFYKTIRAYKAQTIENNTTTPNTCCIHSYCSFQRLSSLLVSEFALYPFTSGESLNHG